MQLGVRLKLLKNVRFSSAPHTSSSVLFPFQQRISSNTDSIHKTFSVVMVILQELVRRYRVETGVLSSQSSCMSFRGDKEAYARVKSEHETFYGINGNR